MKFIKAIIVLIAAMQLTVAGAQNISGVINIYTTVKSVTCSSITVTSAMGFKAGDTVMIIAMRGAYADTTDNNRKFGFVTNYNTVGNYELDIIKSIAGTTINLQSGLIRTYNPSTADVQLIRVPYYNNATVTGKLTCAPWNGLTGGVLAFRVAGTLTLSASIDVSGMGFRGGIYSIVDGSQGDTAYYYTYASGFAGCKGEGISDSGVNFAAGRGALANAAGGGDGHNSGGGGGGNYGHGGIGGDQWGGYGKIANGGLGGDTLLYSNKLNRIFMGGGGGGPHQNNNQATKGASGGGIILISANTVIGNSNNIMANGLSVTDTSGLDGAGGAGAGGAILLDVNSYSSKLNVTAYGGNGGLANCWYNDCIGTGGGGGGGAVWVSTPGLSPNVYPVLNGGLPGLDINNSSGGCYMSPYGADTGKPGGIVYGLKVPLSFPPKVIVPSACGGSGVSAYVSGGGTPVYSYKWAPGGQTTDSISGLAPGNYTVVVKDGCGLDTSLAFVIPTGGVSVTTGINNGPTCAGDSNGTASVKVTGGIMPYTYNWSPYGGTKDTATHLAAGIYIITVTDSAGCKAIDTIKMVQPTIISVTAKAISASCGKSNGSAFAVATGGTSPYTFSWTPSAQTSDTAKGLAAGIFSVTVTDFNGCSTVKALTIVGDSGISTGITHSNVKCFGDSNGRATAVVSGGVSPFKYLWQTTGDTNITDSTLKAGVYTLYVTDVNKCTAIDTVTIGQPNVLAASMGSIVNELCNGDSKGSARVTVTGGTASYSYTWSPSGGTNAVASNLGAGTYTVSITDANGCKIKDSATIAQPTAVRDSVSKVTNVLCNGSSTGSATVGVKDGTPPYTYVWSNSQTTISATNLSAGTYTVTVKDSNGCSSKVMVTITQPTAIRDSMGSVTEKCNGGNNGSAWVMIKGGTAPYSYSWSPLAGTNDTLSNVTAGTYTVTITDLNGCKAINSVTISQPPPIGISTGTTQTFCNVNNGTATANASGGNQPYTYTWSSGTTGTTATGLGAGNYTVTVTDNNNCQNTAVVTITQYPAPVLSVNTTPAACDSSNGTATVIAIGAASPVTYLWSNGSTNSTATALAGGTYTVTVTDAHGCGGTDTVNVAKTPPPVIKITNPGPICKGDSVILTASGGNKYLWSNGATTSTIKVSPSATASYTVTTTNGCVDSAFTKVIVDIPALNVCCDTTINIGGTAFVTAIGSLNYVWSPQSTVNCYKCPSTAITPVTVGVNTYTVTGTDSNGCISSGEVIINVNCAKFTVPNVFTPNGDGQNDEFVIKAEGAESYLINIYDRWGVQVYSSTNPAVYWDGKNKGGKMVSDGVYYYIIKSSCGSVESDFHGFVQVIK